MCHHVRVWRALLWGLLAAQVGCAVSSSPEASASDSISTASACRPVDGTERPIPLHDAPLPLACHGLYVDPAMTDAEREQVKGLYSQAVADISAFFGPESFAANGGEPPAVVMCTSDDCEVTFSGPTKRSHAQLEPYPTVYLSGLGPLTRGTITHEMTHIVLGLKQRVAGATAPVLPAWLNEGTATFVGDNVNCAPGMAPGIDDLRRLDAGSHWWNFTNLPGKINPTYCQAEAEVSGWVAKHSRAALVEAIEAFYRGVPFEEAYGPLVVSPSVAEHVLDVRLPLDEGEGTDTLDLTGRAHAAALSSRRLWTQGHFGFGVQVQDGAHVRLDGLYDLGLPDMPFSLSLWTKADAGARVLVHSAMNESGGDGWCIPVLGQDGAGHLVGQIPFASRNDAFLVAKAPALPEGVWSHVVLTWTPEAGVSLYVDGQLAASARPASAEQQLRDAPATPLRLFFGSDVGASCWRGGVPRGNWAGALDEIRVYSYALSADEIATLAH
jgi:hypothetical protein